MGAGTLSELCPRDLIFFPFVFLRKEVPDTSKYRLALTTTLESMQ